MVLNNYPYLKIMIIICLQLHGLKNSYLQLIIIHNHMVPRKKFLPNNNNNHLNSYMVLSILSNTNNFQLYGFKQFYLILII